jgi:nucleoid DNA-binding protein
MIRQLSEHIARLLYYHDCVIIPDFGGLIGRYQSARLHPVTHTLTAPQKRISFNENLKFNDGLLAKDISTAKGISYDEAVQWIAQAMSIAMNKMESGLSVEFHQVGVFHMDEEGNIQFKSAQEVNFNRHAFGLASVNSGAIQRRKEVEEEVAEVREKLTELPSAVGRKKLWRAAAILLPLIGLGVAGYMMKPQLQQHYWDYATLNPFVEVPASVYTPVERDPIVFEHDEVDPVDYLAWVKTEIKREAEEIERENASRVGAYQVVAGCFSELNNAQGLVRSLSNQYPNAGITGKSKSGLWVVSYSTFESRSEALRFLSTIRSDVNSDAWLLRN